MDEFIRFAKLGNVYLWYIGKKMVSRNVLVVWNKIWKVLGRG